MPRRELKSGKQVADWLAELGASLKSSGNLTLIGSAALLWHAHDRSITSELPEALIGSEFERTHGWHVNLMPDSVLKELPADWEQRAIRRNVGKLNLLVPAPADLLAPKLKRNEPRDRAHAEWAKRVGLLG